MSNIVSFESAKLPAYLKPKGGIVNMFAAAVSAGGFPVISIKGKVFHIQRGDERTLVTKPDDAEEPASSLEIAVVGLNPNKSKVYYSEGFQEGSAEKPTCYSNDGIAPAADSQEAQAKKCAICVHNQWGSRISDNGSKGKACADHMRLAVAPAGQLNDPMLLRVPAASLKTLGQYGDLLAKRGVTPMQVITKVGFDYSVAHPALTFKAVRFVTEEELAEIEETSKQDTVAQITGTAAAPAGADEPFEQPAPKPVAKKSALLAAAEEEAESVPKARVKVEDDEAPATKKAKPVEVEAPAPKAKKAETIAVDDIESALDNLDFDD
jgi:hypothetical protein